MRRVAIYALLAPLALAACKKASEETTPQAVVGAKVETVVAQTFPVVISAIGLVVPRPGSYALMSAPAPARVLRIFHALGDHVAAGTAIVDLEHGTFDADAMKAQAAFDAATRAFDRAVRLEKAGIIPRKDMESAATDLANARAGLVLAKRNQQLATVRTPVSGTISKLNAVMGSQVDVTQPLVEVINTSAMQIDMDVPGRDAGAIVQGDAVQFFSGQDTRGLALGTGTVVGVAPDVDSVARSVAVRATIPRPVRPLRSGESVYARITVAVHANAIVVPAEALVPDGEGYKVFVVNKDNMALSRPVTVGQKTQVKAEILSGLKAGERIVTYGAYGVDDSTKIQVNSTKVPVKP
jgi:membrane fusion protein, multidrug efflux system